jgi:geranylgeranyl reductase family protein
MAAYDVIIVGAGPAGSALAIQLARRGYETLLLEKDRFPRDKVCGDFVSPRGLLFLRELGCLADVEAEGCVRIRKSTVYLNGRKLSEGYLPHLPDHPAYGYAVPRERLDEIIFRRAQAAGASTVERCRVIDLEHRAGAVRIVANVDGTTQAFDAHVIVGADGAQSTVARIAGLAMQDHRYVLASMRSYCTGLSLEETILSFEEEFFPGFAWIFPIDESRANVGVGMVSEPLTRGGTRLRQFYDKFCSFIDELARAQGRVAEISRATGWPIKTYGGARENYFERGLLIGEAACLVDPISGEGIPLALESALLAADVIDEIFEDGDFSATSLSRYETVWRDRYDPDLRVSDLIVSILRNRHLVKLWLTSFEIMSKTALLDEDYALKTGGILAGLVPNREGFSPEIVAKTLFHSPQFWMDVFDVRGEHLLLDAAIRTVELSRWESEAALHLLADFEWFRAWLDEIDRKQRELILTPGRSSGGLLARRKYASSRSAAADDLRLYPDKTYAIGRRADQRPQRSYPSTSPRSER